MLWKCPAWETARAPLVPPIVSAANALAHRPNDPRRWPPCLRLCGILPQDLAKGASEDDQGALVLAVHTMFRAVAYMRMQEEGRSQKLFDVPQVPQGSYPYRDLSGPLPRRSPVPELRVGPIQPKHWRWDPAFKECLVAWLRDLQWQEHDGSVSFLELALDFEAHSGRALPAAQGHA